MKKPPEIEYIETESDLNNEKQKGIEKAFSILFEEVLKRRKENNEVIKKPNFVRSRAV